MRYAEQARTAYFAVLSDRAGVSFSDARGIGPILASFDIKFVRPVNWPAVLVCGTRVSNFAREFARFRMEHKLVLNDASGQVVAVASGTAASVDYDAGGKPVPLPMPLRRAIEQIEGRQVPLE